MAVTLAGIRAKLPPRLQDEADQLTTSAGGDLDQAIDAALAEFSRDRPRRVALEVEGTDAFDLLLASLGDAGPPSTQWAPDWSTLLQVVYPYVSTSRDLHRLEADEYVILDLPAGPTLRLLSVTPSSSETLLLVFTRPHALDENAETVPDAYLEALANLSAAYAFEALASFYAQGSDSSIEADVVDHRGRSAEYRTLAGAHRSRYWIAVGRGMDGSGQPSGGASAFVDIDRRFGDHARTDYFFHGRRRF